MIKLLKKWAKAIGVPGLLHRVNRVWMRMCGISGITSDLFFLFNGEFRREHRAVIAGRLKHLRSRDPGLDDQLTGAEYTLRRNIHRLEKGLTMQPRRPSFATDYILETIECFEALAQHRYCDRWNDGFADVTDIDQTSARIDQYALGVLRTYFQVVDASDSRIAEAKKRFEKVSDTAPRNITEVGPYPRSTRQHGITYDSLMQLCLQRRSCRWYDPRPVPKELLRNAVRTASLSPSACNRQPFRYVIFDRPEDARRIAGIPMGTGGYSDQVPCLIVIVGDLAAYPFSRDRHAMYIDASLASMALLLSLEVQGLASCCINWPDIERLEKKMEKELGLVEHERPLMCISVGYPAENCEVPFSQKKSVDELAHFVEQHSGTSQPTETPSETI